MLYINSSSGSFLNYTPQANPRQYDRVEDLTELVHLNEPSVLHVLRQRYGASLIHTFAGRHLIVINPMRQLASAYSDKVCVPTDAKSCVSMNLGVITIYHLKWCSTVDYRCFMQPLVVYNNTCYWYISTNHKLLSTVE